ncbi:hypothetical protein AB0J83_24580 [Actinoplanes sp. NPDC049596]|uniref:hypothetical protein n=1 Tax=unclassified Actinoplanes TaxID=2626549 RepID=UPI00343ED958
MVRTQPSPADTALLEAAGERGAKATVTQLERWRTAGLLVRNDQRGAGQGRGSVSIAPAEAVDLVVWLSAHARPGRRPENLALQAFGAGLPIPEPTVRRAWLTAATDLQQDVFLGPNGDGDRSAWIGEVADELAGKHGGKIVLLPRRLRDIDARIAASGISFTMPELAAFDKGPTETEPYTTRDFLTTAVSAVLGGTSEFVDADLAAVSRALAPPGAAVPVASMLEYPDGGPALADINDGSGLNLLPAGDARDELTRIVTDASLAQLRSAWQAVDEMHRWAASLCDTVEAELDAMAAGDPPAECPGLMQWFYGVAFGLNRLLLRQALLEPAPPPKAQASTAVMLLFLATGVSRLRVLVPDGQFELLPVLLPPFLYQLVAVDLPAGPRRDDPV